MATKPAKQPRPRWAWDPVELELHEISAIKAVALQHPAAFACIVEKIARVDSISFAAGGVDGQRATDFAEGMRFVGKQLRNIRDLKMPSPTSGKGPPPDLPNSPTTMPATAVK